MTATSSAPDPAAPPAADPAHRRGRAIGIATLMAGALCIALAPVMVKLSPLGPQASAVWRLAVALPVLAIWALLERRLGTGPQGARDAAPVPVGWLVLAGVLFAGDLITWHAGIVRTSTANTTFLANLTPVVVVAFTWLVGRKAPQRAFLLAVAVALAGSLLLSGGAPGSDPERLLGDALSALTSVWYAAYILVIARVRPGVGTGTAMFVSTLVALPLCAAASLIAGEPLWPEAAQGWSTLWVLWPMLVLGLVSHAGGQGLLAFALGRVPAPLASVLILIQPVAAGLLGWLVLAEVLAPVQILGGALVLFGVWLARRSG